MLERVFPFLSRRQRLSCEVLRTVQTVADQVVMAVEQTFRMSGERKKHMALRMTGEILTELGVEVPELVLDTAIEASVFAMKILEQAAESKPAA